MPTTVTMTAAEIARPLDVPKVVNADGSTWGPPIDQSNQDMGFGWLVDVARVRAKTPSGRMHWGQTAWIECGWPWRSMDLHWSRLATDGSWPNDPTPSAGWCEVTGSATPPGMTVALFPLRPIWPGVLVNTLVFAGVAALIFTLVRGARRRFRNDRAALRRTQGRCVRCAYPLQGLATCPECGLAAEDGIAAPKGGPPPPSPLP